MKKVFLSLFVVISLLSAPIAHAAGLLCANDDCAKITKHDHSKNSKHESKVDDHCCTHNLSPNATNSIKTFVVSVVAAPQIGEDEKADNFIAGPPLKPPSHV